MIGALYPTVLGAVFHTIVAIAHRGVDLARQPTRRFTSRTLRFCRTTAHPSRILRRPSFNLTEPR